MTRGRNKGCKRCGRQHSMATPEDRARYATRIFDAIALWLRTPGRERGVDDAVCEQLARASVYAEYLVAADRGYCRDCSPEMVQPATSVADQAERPTP